MSREGLHVEEDGHVCLLTLNRPDAMNALNMELLLALQEQIHALRTRRDIRALIVSGAGEKAFCAGADLKERAEMSQEQVKEYIHTIRTLFSEIEELNKPVIAAINGVALGGGTELALACDIRFAADTATMGLTETKLAIIPGAGGTQRLPRIVGRSRAKEMILTGRRVDAAEAERIGLVTEVCPSDVLLSRCRETADAIAENGPVAVEQAKFAINRGLETDMNTGLAIESAAYWVTIPTEDRLEGLKAFKEKRKPQYTGQ
ncbi:MAG: enoyl-CoA hydratase [Desulfohalobiaceae bacterium]